MMIYRQRLFERITGISHLITINFESRRVYEVRFDGEFYSTAENKVKAFEEVVDIIKTFDLRPINMAF